MRCFAACRAGSEWVEDLQMDTSHLIPGGRTLHLVDFVIACWVLGWVGLGVAIGVEVNELESLTHTVVVEGRAVEAVGGTLHDLSNVPLLGGEIGSTAEKVQRAGQSAVASGTSSRGTVDTLAVLLAIAVALLPSVPVFGFYVPLRLHRRHEARALRRAIAAHAGDPQFELFLARRAVEALGYDRLRRVSTMPWEEIDAGRRNDLAAAELRRLGIDPSVLEGARART
jgi:hypothetical protein